MAYPILMGRWNDRNVVGGPMMAPLPDVTNGMLWLLGAVGFAKFYAPAALLLTGLCAWFFFRQLELVISGLHFGRAGSRRSTQISSPRPAGVLPRSRSRLGCAIWAWQPS